VAIELPATPEDALALSVRYLEYSHSAIPATGNSGYFATIAATYASIAAALRLERVEALLALPAEDVTLEPEESPAERRRRLDRERKAASREKAERREAELRHAADDGPEAVAQ
jgi:hypothetical protein